MFSFKLKMCCHRKTKSNNNNSHMTTFEIDICKEILWIPEVCVAESLLLKFNKHATYMKLLQGSTYTYSSSSLQFLFILFCGIKIHYSEWRIHWKLNTRNWKTAAGKVFGISSIARATEAIRDNSLRLWMAWLDMLNRSFGNRFHFIILRKYEDERNIIVCSCGFPETKTILFFVKK